MNRRKQNRKLSLVSALPLFLAAALALSACGQAERKTNTIEETLPQIQIGVDNLKPFFYIDRNGDYAGIDADLAAEACRRAGYEPVFTEVAWDERDQYLENGDLDCLWTAFIMDGREDRYNWMDSYLDSDLAVLVEKNAPDKSVEEFQGPGGVAVRAGSRAEELFLKMKNPKSGEAENVYSCGTFSMALTAFVKGYANGLAGHRIVLQQLVDSNPGEYKYLEEHWQKVHLGVAFRKGQEAEMHDRIDQALREMKADGTIRKIAEQYGMDADESGEAAEHEEK